MKSEFSNALTGGLNLKVLIIDLPAESVREAAQFRAEQSWTVAQLKISIAEVESLSFGRVCE